jgi:hypothetical protein
VRADASANPVVTADASANPVVTTDASANPVVTADASGAHITSDDSLKVIVIKISAPNDSDVNIMKYTDDTAQNTLTNILKGK